MESITVTTSASRPVHRNLMKPIVRYHRWLAVAAGLFLFMQGLSGSLLMFREAIEPVIHPDLVVSASGDPVSAQQLVETVNGSFSDFGIGRVEFPEQSDRAVIFKISGKQYADEKVVAVDPYRNRIVRQGGIAAWPLEWMLHWHEHLQVGSVGEIIIGFVGLTLLFMAVSGLIVWWPRGRLASGFRIARGGKERTWRTAHRAIGAMASTVLIFSAMTGSLMVFKDPIREMLSLAGPVAAKPSGKVAERKGVPLVSIDQLIAKTQAEIGPSPLRQLRFAHNDGRSVSVYLDSTHKGVGGVTSFVSFDRYTGKELGRYVSGQLPTNNAVIDYLYPLHSGAAGGTVVKAVLLFVAVSLVFLGISGPALWMVRSRRRKALREKENSA